MGSICPCGDKEETPYRDPSHLENVYALNSANSGNKQNFLRVKAIFDYTARHQDDLSFLTGETFYVENNQEADWFSARRATNNEFGYIPRNHVLIINDEIENHESWQTFSRGDAVRQLLKVGLENGTFILRPSRLENAYALSVRYHQKKDDIWKVLHYKIIKTDDGRFYMGSSQIYNTISDLIEYFKRNDLTLNNRLSKPFPKDYRPPIHFRDVEVNRNSFTMIEKIGEGKFGAVHHAKWNDIVDVAIKSHLKKNNIENFIKEAKIMHQLRHPKIVEFLGVSTKPEDEPILIITEFMVNGSLLAHLRLQETRSNLSFDDLIYMMGQIADGMLYLESKNLIHKDLRAANILVGEDKIVKVSDFGLSFIADDYSEGTDSVFPYKWTAPESLRYKIFTTQSDVWSFGVLMYEIVTYGQIPYPTMSNKETVDYVLSEKVMPQGNIDEKLYNIMLGCWKMVPENRIKFFFLKEIFEDWDALSDQYTNGIFN